MNSKWSSTQPQPSRNVAQSSNQLLPKQEPTEHYSQNFDNSQNYENVQRYDSSQRYDKRSQQATLPPMAHTKNNASAVPAANASWTTPMYRQTSPMYQVCTNNNNQSVSFS